jgi:hypothetical protein
MQFQRMDQAHRARLSRVISVIKNGPEDGKFFSQEADGPVLRQMSGGDTHVVYAVAYRVIGRVLRIVFIEIRDWEPRES